MDRYCGIAVLACLLAAGSAVAATAEERLARGEIVVTRLLAAHRGILGGQSQGVIAAPLDLGLNQALPGVVKGLRKRVMRAGAQ